MSNRSWKAGQLTAVSRQPFDTLVNANSAHKQRQNSIVSADADFENWLPDLYGLRTLRFHSVKDLASFPVVIP